MTASSLAQSLRPPAASPHRMETIDALRGAAALAVVGFHSLAALGGPGDLTPALAAAGHLTRYGYLGVSVFFPLSGWCIAQRLHVALKRSEPAPEFILERFLRIFPSYSVALAAAIALRLAAAPFRQNPDIVNLPQGWLAWIGDALLIQPYLATPVFLLVSWSLVYELGFYALAAGALYARQRGVRGGGILAIGFLLCCWPLVGGSTKALTILARWPDFFAGVLAWYAARHGGRAGLASGVAGLLALAFLHPDGFGDIIRLTAVATALLLLFVSHGKISLPRRAGALPWVGAFSYSLYLIHVPVMSPFMNLAQRFVSPRDGAFVLVWLSGIALAVASGGALHRLCEAPVERWRKRLFAPRPAAAAA